MAGDKDADTYFTAFVGPQNEKKIRDTLIQKNNDYLHEYTKYQVRYQMLKPKRAAAVEGLTTIESMIGGAQKLAVVPEYVPKLSLQMTESRRAVRAFGQGRAAADAEMLLTWLEQTPIASKHLSAEQAARGELGSMMSQLSSALESGDKRAAKEVISDITRNSPEAEQLLKGTVRLSPEDAARIGKLYGIKDFDTELGGVDVDSALDEIFSTKRKYADSGLAREAEILSGRGNDIKTKEIPAFADAVMPKLPGRGTGLMSGLIEKGLAAKNFMSSVGQSVIKNKTAVGLGFAATLALGAVLSNPKKTLGPGSATIPPDGLIKRANSAGTNLTQQDIAPQSQPVGAPSVPALTSTNTSSHVSLSQGRNYTIRGVIPAGSTNRGIASLARLTSGDSSNISVNLRDRRYKSNKYLDNKG
jgi:hypothetical protein